MRVRVPLSLPINSKSNDENHTGSIPVPRTKSLYKEPRMRVSELIEKLKSLKEDHGDLSVELIYDDSSYDVKTVIISIIDGNTKLISIEAEY